MLSRPVKAPPEEAALAVPLAVQKWVDARLQLAAEEATAAALAARELQEMQLASAIEGVAADTLSQIHAAALAARELYGTQLATAIEEVVARTFSQTQAAALDARELHEMHLATAIEEVAARISSRMQSAASGARNRQPESTLGAVRDFGRVDVASDKSLRALQRTLNAAIIAGA